jgi:hypothetical protein
MPLGPHTVSVRKGIFELSRTCPFQELSRCQSCKHRAFAFSSVPRRPSFPGAPHICVLFVLSDRGEI